MENRRHRLYIVRTVIIGVVVAILLNAVGLSMDQPSWWVGCITLNFAGHMAATEVGF